MRKVYSNILLIVGWLFLVFSIYLFLWTFIEEISFYIGTCVLILGLLSLFFSNKIVNHSGNFLSLYDQ
jgi:F0F1-type ATP synthase assembly protein I